MLRIKSTGGRKPGRRRQCTSAHEGRPPAERAAALARGNPQLHRASELAGPDRRCPRCQSGKLAEHALAAVPGWSRWQCVDCHSPAGMALSPTRDRQWAEGTRLNFGKFKGQTVGELARSARGRSYLCWAIDTIESQAHATAVEAARIVMGEPRDTGPPCPRCGSDRAREVKLTNSVHFAKLLCADCGRCHRFLPRPAAGR